MSILMIYCFFNHPATTEIYTYLHTLSLPDSLPIYGGVGDDDERRPGLRQKLRHLGLHRHAVFAVADADQHRRRRRVDRLRSPERGPGASARLDRQAGQARPAIGAALYLHRHAARKSVV